MVLRVRARMQMCRACARATVKKRGEQGRAYTLSLPTLSLAYNESIITLELQFSHAEYPLYSNVNTSMHARRSADYGLCTVSAVSAATTLRTILAQLPGHGSLAPASGGHFSSAQIHKQVDCGADGGGLCGRTDGPGPGSVLGALEQTHGVFAHLCGRAISIAFRTQSGCVFPHLQIVSLR